MKYTKEECQKIALKYETKKIFLKNEPKIVWFARRYNFLDEICSHMKIIGNRFKRCIYAFEFDDNSVYIGLTQNINKRKEFHFTKEKSTVYKKIKNSNLIPTLKQLTGYIDVDIASLKEQEYINIYKNNNWNILNYRKGGGLGGGYLKWSKEKCHIIANKYNTKKEFQIGNRNCYESARRQGYLEEICSHMKILRMPNGYWTKEKCKEEAIKYKTMLEFRKYNRTCFDISRNNNYLKDICSHMIKCKNIRKWTLDKCKDEIMKYDNLTDFRLLSKSCYESARSQNILTDLYDYYKGYKNKVKK